MPINSTSRKVYLSSISCAFCCLSLLLFSCNTDEKTEINKDLNNSQHKVFERLSSTYSGINFENNITANLETLENLFNFDYFYNGAGVGVEDLNNDGLLDIVFCGNQVGNKIFLNKGELQFEDITSNSGINTGKQWANGVTFADVNADGWMDIYISQGGPNQRLQRKNVLLLNKQDGTFSEEAEAYGLADMGISTQSAFFDMDNDGDLDCIVMNENEYYGVDPIALEQLIKGNPEAAYFNSSHIYLNEGGKFRDVTVEAGIQRPIFGLGLSVHDFNKDGYTDIYIASDYYLPDAMFINNGNGTFTDRIKEYTNQISYFGMGMDVADIDNDLLEDIFVLDMASSDHVRSKTLMASMNTNRFDYLVNKAGFHYQYMFNSLQYNHGENRFSNIAHLTGISNTDWSWTVLMSDFDLDTNKDIYITNGYRRYALDNDLQQQVFRARQQYGQNIPMSVKTNLYEAMPSEKLPNLLYKNTGNLNFIDAGETWGLGDYSFSNGAAMGDLDNDGDIDLVVNNMDENAFLYKNLSVDKKLGNYLNVELVSPISEPEAEVRIYHGNHTQLITPKRVRGYMAAHENMAHFGLGDDEKVDSLIVAWNDGSVNVRYDVLANQKVVVDKSEASNTGKLRYPSKSLFQQVNPEDLGIRFTHRENNYDDFEEEVLLPYKQSQWGPPLAVADVNNDGLDDVYFGGASGQAGELYLQRGDRFQPKRNPDFTRDSGHEDTDALFFDFEGDGDIDLYVVSGGNEFDIYSSFYSDRLYLNDGQGNFKRADQAALNSFPQSGRTAVSFDFDQDGDQDILVGNGVIPRQYPIHAPSQIFENRDGVLVNVTASVLSELEDFGIINAIEVSDIDGDGDEDLLMAGEWTTIGIFSNESGKFKRVDGDLTDRGGWWYSITPTDVNKDGRPDYILGNAGMNIKFKASVDKPFKVYAADFDNNGTNDIVLGKKYRGEYVPVRGRECSSQQMPFIADKFPTFKEFAQASVEDVFGEALEASYSREVTEFRSMILINKGNFQFELYPLPVEAQMFPVLAGIELDLDNDGTNEVILAGNIYETEVETPRLDAFSGLILRSSGNSDFTAFKYDKTGLFLDGNIKDLGYIRTKNATLLLANSNNDRPLVYKLNDF